MPNGHEYLLHPGKVQVCGRHAHPHGHTVISPTDCGASAYPTIRCRHHAAASAAVYCWRVADGAGGTTDLIFYVNAARLVTTYTSWQPSRCPLVYPSVWLRSSSNSPRHRSPTVAQPRYGHGCAVYPHLYPDYIHAAFIVGNVAPDIALLCAQVASLTTASGEALSGAAAIAKHGTSLHGLIFPDVIPIPQLRLATPRRTRATRSFSRYGSKPSHDRTRVHHAPTAPGG